jgi:two-component system, NarL family, sensor histidine kinase UhpB
LVEAQEAERRHLSRELHDEIGQMLTALKFSLEAGKHDVSDSKIDNALNITTDLMNQVRGLSLQLRPPMLDTLGLVAALRWQFERYTEQTGITVHFKCNHPPRRYAPSVELTAFRVTQEALNNIARYAQVSEAFVILNVGEAALHLSIEDKGVGFDYEKTKKAMTGSGLLGMQERVALVGGQFSIDAQPGQGTKISAEIYI